MGGAGWDGVLGKVAILTDAGGFVEVVDLEVVGERGGAVVVEADSELVF